MPVIDSFAQSHLKKQLLSSDTGSSHFRLFAQYFDQSKEWVEKTNNSKGAALEEIHTIAMVKKNIAWSSFPKILKFFFVFEAEVLELIPMQRIFHLRKSLEAPFVEFPKF